MPKARLPYLIHEKNRHGNRAWFFRRGRGSQRIRLFAPYGTPEFMAEYQAALTGTAPPARPSLASARDKESLQWLVDHWHLSSDWKLTASSTRRQRENILLHVLQSGGKSSFRAITRQHILDGRERRQATPFAANNFLKTMRALFKWAKDAGHVDVNPAADVPFLNVRTEGFEPWTYADVQAYRRRWPLGTRARLALETIYATGLRRGDVVRLGQQHLQPDGFFQIVTEKTGETVYPPMTPALAEALAAGPKGAMIYNVGADGLPMVKESFGNSFADWCRAAGFKKSAHGLRKLVVTEAAEAGCTETQLQDMFGWTTIKQSAIYTRSRTRQKSAARGWAKRVGNGGDTNPR